MLHIMYIDIIFQIRLVCTNKKPLLSQITYYELVFPVIYLYLVAFLHFFYDFFFFFWALVLISHSAFSPCTIFKPN